MTVLYLVYLIAVPVYVPDPRDVSEEGQAKIPKGHARHIGVECVIRPPKMAVLLLSIHPLLDQSLLHLHLLT